MRCSLSHISCFLSVDYITLAWPFYIVLVSWVLTSPSTARTSLKRRPMTLSRHTWTQVSADLRQSFWLTPTHPVQYVACVMYYSIETQTFQRRENKDNCTRAEHVFIDPISHCSFRHAGTFFTLNEYWTSPASKSRFSHLGFCFIADSSPKCYSPTDPRLNSTAWFVNYIGVFVIYVSSDDLDTFGSEDTVCHPLRTHASHFCQTC